MSGTLGSGPTRLWSAVAHCIEGQNPIGGARWATGIITADCGDLAESCRRQGEAEFFDAPIALGHRIALGFDEATVLPAFIAIIGLGTLGEPVGGDADAFAGQLLAGGVGPAAPVNALRGEERSG